jgi:hypothetical protein
MPGFVLIAVWFAGVSAYLVRQQLRGELLDSEG